MAISEAERRGRIAQRCWEVYDRLVRHFSLPEEFLLRFVEEAELASLTGALRVRVRLAEAEGHLLELVEEYELRDHALHVVLYSYVLLREGVGARLRADPLPHHEVDHRGRPLEHFPHHLHDERGRIHSFSGRLEDFLQRVRELLG